MTSLSRLFIALRVDSPWPQVLPQGKLLKEEDRHLTLSFLGDQDAEKCKAALDKAPSYPELVSPCGYFDGCLLLPEKEPNVVSWHAHFDSGGEGVTSYQLQLEQFLKEQKLLQVQPKQAWLPHVTICRKPFNAAEWNAAFEPLPFVIESCALYKSLGNLSYELLWEENWLLPFEKLPHTADLAFIIRGKTLHALFRHAQLALGFTHPPLLSYKPLQKERIESIEEVIAVLNRFITEEDTRVGCPMKAVSYHCDHVQKGDLIEWEMIIDV